MGWTTIRTSGNVVEDLRNHLFDRNEEILKWNKKGDIYYFALRREGQDKVYAEIVLTELIDKELSFKNMGENSGPFYYGASKSLIRMLSPTDDEDALEWRKRCLYELKKGSRCKFEKPLHLEDKEYSDFIYYGNNLFIPLNEDFCFREKNWRYKIKLED